MIVSTAPMRMNPTWTVATGTAKRSNAVMWSLDGTIWRITCMSANDHRSIKKHRAGPRGGSGAGRKNNTFSRTALRDGAGLLVPRYIRSLVRRRTPREPSRPIAPNLQEECPLFFQLITHGLPEAARARHEKTGTECKRKTEPESRKALEAPLPVTDVRTVGDVGQDPNKRT